jgi:hypothetical protein
MNFLSHVRADYICHANPLLFINSVREESGSITRVWVSHQKQGSRGNGFARLAGIFNESFSRAGKMHTTDFW